MKSAINMNEVMFSEDKLSSLSRRPHVFNLTTRLTHIFYWGNNKMQM